MTAVVAGGGLLEGVFSSTIVVVELFADPPSVDLFPEEAEVVAQAVGRRQREFATVRLCARMGLARLGLPPQPILPTRDGPPWACRAPRWPDGIVGSMTHCDGYRAAAVARSAEVVSLGIDAEPNIPLPRDVQDLVMLPEERATVARLAVSHPGVAWDRVVFSAKESVYKTWYPLVGTWLDFSDCVISPDPDLGTFTGTLRVVGSVGAGVAIERFTGKWRVRNTDRKGHIATAVMVAPSVTVAGARPG